MAIKVFPRRSSVNILLKHFLNRSNKNNSEKWEILYGCIIVHNYIQVKYKKLLKLPHCSTLEAYEETHVFIPVGITEDVVDLIAPKLYKI